MTTQEFLYALDDHLKNQVSAQEITDIIQYYQRYIRNAVSEGQTESQVLESLGDPYLIAKTIIDSSHAEQNQFQQNNTAEPQFDQSYGGSHSNQSRQNNTNRHGRPQSAANAKLTFYAIIALVILITILIVVLSIRIIIWLLPFILIVIAIKWLFSVFSGNRH